MHKPIKDINGIIIKEGDTVMSHRLGYTCIVEKNKYDELVINACYGKPRVTYGTAMFLEIVALAGERERKPIRVND